MEKAKKELLRETAECGYVSATMPQSAETVIDINDYDSNRRHTDHFQFEVRATETRKHRLLPPTPVDSVRPSTSATGRLEVQVRYEMASVKVTVRQASGLKRETNESGQLDLPNPYVKVSLLPGRWQYPVHRTETLTVNAAPVWNKMFVYYDITEEELHTKSLEFTLWDYHPKENNTFMGEVVLDLNAVNLDGLAQWYNLTPHDENNGQLMQPTPKKSDQKGESEPAEDIQTPVPPMPAHERAKSLLKTHHRGSGTLKRFLQRHLTRSSLTSPTSSLRSSVQGRDLHLSDSELSDHTQTTSQDYTALRDNSDISQLPCNSESISSTPVCNTVPNTPDCNNITESRKNSEKSDLSESDVDNYFSDFKERHAPKSQVTVDPGLGPGQVQLPADRLGQGAVKLRFTVTKGNLEVDIFCAKGLPVNNNEIPDTYVKTYLRQGQKRFQKRKTRIVRKSLDPVYKEKINYLARDVHGRHLQVMIWVKQGGFEKNQCLGEVIVNMDMLNINCTKHRTGWYMLYQHLPDNFGSNDSLNNMF
ncbi:regulating synaptic membrane exocytosis protein 1-like [Lingula anatina]|uniref:Regulating synaptic membrane exocytosis protein 1-like n=1 Tax=Lingula anatina TaxID=7574 RepID=A0A1S3H7H0_LINAN|nr:regulating synaptic membrane exocytosis protein 1-like [Lingula anatina]|eukprot:XP_013382065.1 regulating synaptic membrane exocytosis protein 1-like [Lingula anatina]